MLNFNKSQRFYIYFTISIVFITYFFIILTFKGCSVQIGTFNDTPDEVLSDENLSFSAKVLPN